MSIVVTTAAASDPVTRTEAKAHCRVDISTDDTLIDGLIAAATDAVQIRTGRQLINATFRAAWDMPGGVARVARSDTWIMYLNGVGAAIPLLREPLQSVTSVKYYDADEVQQTLDSSKYWVDSDSTPPRVVLKEWFPSLYGYRPGLVQIVFVAGYGSSASSVPAALKHAIKLLVGHWYENREAHIANGYARELPDGVKAICDSYKAAWIKG